MIRYIKKDITTVDVGVLGHGVNCQHKMRSGVAKTIREKWPEVYESYMGLPKGKTMLGATHVITINEDLHVANMYTQEFYGYDGKRYADLESIEMCTVDLLRYSLAYALPLYLPKIGSARGGLDWDAEIVPALNRSIRAVDDTAIINICEWS
jgi:O-acetyl-ADP-ribose deacetylase (regulator of RNase III)